MTNEILDAPPFPPLQWDRSFWTGEVVLPSWAGFRSRRGAYGSARSAMMSDGSAVLTVMPADKAAQTPPLPTQAAAFDFLLANESAVGDAVLRAIFIAFPAMRDSYINAYEEAAESMPEIDGIDQLRDLIGISGVHVSKVDKDGLAYVGFEFGCNWDREHGLGVMTHRNRIVRVGTADVSFLAWIAERDAERKG